MRVSEFQDFDDIEHEALLSGSKERNWIWCGLIVSLCLHISLCIYFYRTRFQSLETAVADVQQTPTFNVRTVDLKQLAKASAEQLKPASKPQPDNTAVQQPEEKKSFDKLLEE